MYSVSEEFQTLVKTSHQIVTRIAILENGLEISLPVELKLVSGSIVEDKNASIRRTATFQIVDATNELIPEDLYSIIAPNRNEIAPYRGIMTSAGAEYVPLGIFGFKEIEIDDSGTGVTMTIQGFDRSERLARERLLTTYIVPAGTAVETAITDIANSRTSGLEFAFSTTGRTTPLMNLDRGSDPWQIMTDLAESAGYELFFDESGVLTLQAEPDPSVNSVDLVFADASEAVIISTSRKLGFPSYNHVVEIGEGANITVPFSAEAYDTNPSSPTYIGFGDYPLFHVSPLFVNVAQAQAAADARLRKILGATENVSFTCVPNPALQASDVIAITQERVKIDNSVYVVDKLTTPLTASEGQTCVVRERVIN